MNRTSPVVGRLAAEFAVIVIGVLVALAADEWRSEREDRAAVRETLGVIVGELDSDSVALLRARGLVRQQRAAAERLIELRTDYADVSRDSVSTLFETLTRSGPLALSGGGYESFRSARGLDVVNDTELRSALVEYYDFRTNFLEDIRGVAVERFLFDFYPLLQRHTVPWLEPDSPRFLGETRPGVRLDVPLQAVMADRELMSGVARLSEFLWYYRVVLDLALEENRALAALIRESVDG